MITNKEYCKCPVCGSACEVDTSTILASNPPQYKAFCKKCNKVIYTLCSDVYGITSINQENNFIEKDAEYHKDIHRIADALEELVKIFTPSKIVVNEMTDEQKEKYLNDLKTNPSPTRITPITISPSVTPNTWYGTWSDCEHCWWYQQQKANPNPTITWGDTPCTWCPKRQPACICNSEIK